MQVLVVLPLVANLQVSPDLHWQSSVQVPPLFTVLAAVQVPFAQQALAQLEFIMQVVPFAPPDCAWAAVGAINEEITGKAIIEANPTLRITSRLDNPSNRFGISDAFSIKFSFFNWSKASQTISSVAWDFNCLPSKKLISLTEVLPSHAW